MAEVIAAPLAGRLRIAAAFVAVALIAALPARRAPGVAILVAGIAVVSLGRQLSRRSLRDAVMTVASYAAFAWPLTAFVAVVAKRRAFGALPGLLVMPQNREASILSTHLLAAFVGWGFLGGIGALIVAILQRNRPAHFEPAPVTRDRGWTNWLQLHVDGPLMLDAVLPALADLGLTVQQTAEAHTLVIRSPRVATIDRSRLVFTPGKGTYDVALDVRTTRELALHVVTFVSTTLLAWGLIGFAGLVARALRIEVGPEWLFLLLPFGAGPLVACTMQMFKTNHVGRRLPAVLSGGQTGWESPESAARSDVIGVFSSAAMIAGAFPLYLVLVPVSLGIATWALALFEHGLIAAISARATRAVRFQVRALSRWCRHGIHTDLVFLFGGTSALAAVLHSMLRYLARHSGPTFDLPREPDGVERVTNSIRDLWRGVAVDDVATLLRMIHANPDNAAKFADLAPFVENASFLLVLMAIVSVLASRSSLLSRPLAASPVAVSAEHRHHERIRIYAAVMVPVAVLVQALSVLIAVNAWRVVFAGAEGTSSLLRYPVAIVRAISTGAAKIVAFALTLPAAMIVAETITFLWREWRERGRVTADDELRQHYRALWRAHIRGIEPPRIAPAAPGEPPIRTPETRLLLFPPFRYVVLPAWFTPDVVPDDQAIAFLAHEHFHFASFGRAAVVRHILLGLVLRCSNPEAAFAHPDDEFAADAHAMRLWPDGRESLERAIRLNRYLPLPAPFTPSARFSDLFLPRWSAFLHIWPSATARLAALRGDALG